MNLYRPSQLRAFLKERGLFAKKGLSQNFLIDGNVIQKILRVAAIEKGDFVIEIGPGPGALTEALLNAGASVLAIEKDPQLSSALPRLDPLKKQLEVVCADALKFPLLEALKNRRAKVVANLPYQITTPLLTQLLPLYPHLSSLTLMVQKEFADRLRAKPLTAAYGSITLFLQFYAALDKHFLVSPHCFYPRPKVSSCVIHCALHPPRKGVSPEDFFTLTRTAFQQRRKMLKTSLKNLFPLEQLESALSALGISLTARPEELSLDDFISLYYKLH